MPCLKLFTQTVKVVDFYYRPDVIYTAPGLKDEITVWTEKMRKYYLTMYYVRCMPCLKLFTQTVK